MVKLRLTHPNMPMNHIDVKIDYAMIEMLNEYLDYIDSNDFLGMIDLLVFRGYNDDILSNKIIELMQHKNEEIQKKYKPENFI